MDNPEALDPAEPAASAVFDALLNDRPLPGEEGPASPSPTPDLPTPSGEAGVGLATGKTVDPSTVQVTVVNVSGRSGVATQAMDELNNIGFEISDEDLQARPDQMQADVTVEYDPTNLNAALTVAAAVPGATVVPVNGLGRSVRLLLGKDFEGSVDAVRSGRNATATMGTATPAVTSTQDSGSLVDTSALTSINAGAELCA